MALWLTSDTHFGHENIIKYENRPFRDVNEMNESLIHRWNSVINNDDIVYHLGDFGFGKTEDLALIRSKLKGKILLILGNHDGSLAKLQEVGIDGIADELVLQYKTWHFIMTHVPKDDIMFEKKNHAMINIHGHIHGKNRTNNNRINISCDAWDYTPIQIDDALMEYRKTKR